MVTSQDRTDDGREKSSTESELAVQFPGVSLDVIHCLVQESYDRLTPAKVHSYLPILISREVQTELRVRLPS